MNLLKSNWYYPFKIQKLKKWSANNQSEEQIDPGNFKWEY